MEEFFKEDEEDPWAGISATEIQVSIERTVDEGRTFRTVLLDVLNDEERGGEAEEYLDNNSADEVFSRFLEESPVWIVTCEVTDSMVSGRWGLKAFTIGGRGYLYYEPDEDEPYIIGGWEPVNNEQSFRACFLNAYTSRWDECVLPPRMGQWATGPFDVMLEAICAVLQESPESWSTVLEKLRNHEDRGASFEELVERTSESIGMQSRLVAPILRSYSARDGSKVAAVVDPTSLPEQESRVLVAAFLDIINDSPFRR